MKLCGSGIAPLRIRYDHSCRDRSNSVLTLSASEISTLPAVPGSRSVLSKQDVTRAQHKVLARAGLKIERAAQCDDELTGRRIVPFKGAAHSRLAERDADDLDGAAENVATFAVGKVDCAFLEVRVAVVSGPKPNRAYY